MGKAVLITAILLLFFSVAAETGDNPFFAEKQDKEEIRLPPVASGFLSKFLGWQHRLNAKLTEQVKRVKDDRSWNTFLPLIFISFFYGVLHAVGPGHGKVVVFSYFISRKASIKKSIFLGILISFFHAFSGIVIVLALYFVIKTAYLSPFEAISRKIKFVSYSLILLIGLLLLLNSIFNIKAGLNSNTGKKNPLNEIQKNKDLLPIAFAVGMVPCPGVVIIMLFALSFNLLIIGVAMSFIMAMGMAITITMAGIISILGREGIVKGLGQREGVLLMFQKGLAVFGSLIIITLGGVLLAGAL